MSKYFYRAILFIALYLAIAPVSEARQFSNRYDPDIQRAVKHWWPDYPLWRMLKAQLYQESRLDPKAISPVGARGLAQFMPATWGDMIQQMALSPKASPHDDIAIEAAAFYMAKLRSTWRTQRPPDDRHNLALASYNAGLGNLVKAQKACGNAVFYPKIVSCLPRITGKHSEETMIYVDRIWQWFKEMEVTK